MRALVIALFLGWGVFCSHWYVCKILNQCGPETEIVSDRMMDLSLTKDGAAVLSDYEHFKFAEKDNNPVLTENNQAFLDGLAKYLKENPDHKIKITGYYLPGEESPDSYTNMGVSRAAKIRDMLVAKGFNADRFSLSGELLEEGAKLDRPLAFSVIAPLKKEEGAKEEEKTVTVVQTIDNRTYYFDYGSDAFTPDVPFIRYMDEIKKYLAQEENKNKKVYVIGHTDNKGSLGLNKRLSRKRAEQVKAFIVKSEVPSDKIRTESKWYSEPAESNATEEGRAKNRRVQILIK